MQLKDTLPILKPAVEECWSQIAPDIYECSEACGESVDNHVAVEACLDADRLLLVCNNEAAHTLYKAVVKEHGWDKTVKFFAKHCQLA